MCIVQSNTFSRLIGSVILLNVAFMGFSADTELQDLKDGHAYKTYDELGVMDVIFCLAFIVELALRLAAFKKDFFRNPEDRWWNIFDMVLVLQNTLEIFSKYVFQESTLRRGSFSFLRGVRLLKMIRMLRVVRLMRSMREMRMILSATMGSMRSMLWSLVLLVLVLYMFAIIFVQGVVHRLTTEYETSPSGTPDDALVEFWGSVSDAMITLFMSSCGGIDWKEAVSPLYYVGSSFVLLFFLYISVFTFVVVNTVTALFVENTIATANKDFACSIQNELEKKEEYLESLRLLFEEMDEWGTGEVSLEQFERQIENPKLVAFFASLEIEITDATHFFEMLSEYGQKSVTLENFVTGCIRMRGQALAVDLHYLTTKHLVMHTDLATFMERADLRFDSLQRRFVSLQQSLGRVQSPSPLRSESPDKLDTTKFHRL